MPLQRAFRGLSNHLGSFLGGNLTFDANPSLLMQVNAEDFVNPYEWLRTTQGLTAVGQTAIQTVPAGEFWRVRSLHMEAINTVGNANSLAPTFDPDGITQVGLSQIEMTALPVNGRLLGGIFFSPEPLVLPAGASIGWTCTSIAGGTINVDIVLTRQKILI